MNEQLDMFADGFVPASPTRCEAIPRHLRIAPQLGWKSCDCGLVFWEWPRSKVRVWPDVGKAGSPDLRAFGPMLCWRGIRRLIPGYRSSTARIA